MQDNLFLYRYEHSACYAHYDQCLYDHDLSDLAARIIAAQHVVLCIDVHARRFCALAILCGVKQIILAVDQVSLPPDELRARHMWVQDYGFDHVHFCMVSDLDDLDHDHDHDLKQRLPTLQDQSLKTHKGAAYQANQVQTHMIWQSSNAMVLGRDYIVRLHEQETHGVLSHLRYALDLETGAHLPCEFLSRHEIGVCHLSLDEALSFDRCQDNPARGHFQLFDRETGEQVALGLIDYPLRRASDVYWQNLDVNKNLRARDLQQKPCVIWFTGLSGSGKSTLANELETILRARGKHTYILDGDNVRHGLNKDLGFSEEDRVENIRRVSEVAKLMLDAGLIVLVSFISPFRNERRAARDLFEHGEFFEVFVDTPLEECIKRDPKGLYKKALAGEIDNFTGLSSPYERPENAEVHLDMCEHSIETALVQIQKSLPL